MKDRIRQVRMSLGLTQWQFGERLGVSRHSIVNAELGRAGVKDMMVSHICEIFGVDYHWLLTGEGEMFSDTDATALRLLARRYNLDARERRVIRAYVHLPPDKRRVLTEFLESIANMGPDEL